MGEFIKLTASDGAVLSAYRAAPTGAPKAGVVVIQEIFGVNRQVRGVCDRYAADGYLAIAPAIMDRMSPGFETNDYSPDKVMQAREIMAGFKPELGLLDVAAAVKEASSAGKVGITGFCLGGMLTWRAANQGLGLSAASGYYGGGLLNYIDLAPSIPIEMHYGDRDKGIPADQVEQLRQRYPDVPIYLYPADHAFTNEDRPHSYDRDSAEKAHARTLEFFGKHLA